MTHHEAISIWKDSADDALMSEVVGLQTGSSQMIPTECLFNRKLHLSAAPWYRGN